MRVSRTHRWGPLVLSGLMLTAGCTSTSTIRPLTSNESVAFDKAMALPPPGGPSIVSVNERQYSNGVEQTLSLFTSSSVPGQNFLNIHFYGGAGTGDGKGASSFNNTFKEGAILREISRAVPGVRLARSAVYVQNSYGPFAYASGKSSQGDTCLYAWQQIRSSRSLHTAARNFGMIQVRLRLCDKMATERQLLAVAYNYTITGTFSGEIWNPYGAPRGVDPGFGVAGQPVYPDENGYRNNPMPLGYKISAPVQNASAAAAPSGPRVVRARQTAVEPVAVQEAPKGPRVPLPDDQGDLQSEPRISSRETTSQSPLRSSTVNLPLPECIDTKAGEGGCE